MLQEGKADSMEAAMAAVEHAQAEERDALVAKYDAQKEEQATLISEAIDAEKLIQVREAIKAQLELVREN